MIIKNHIEELRKIRDLVERIGEAEGEPAAEAIMRIDTLLEELEERRLEESARTAKYKKG